MSWINVNDKMPKIGQFVLGYCSKQFYKEDVILCHNDGNYKPIFEEWRGVVYWMPLPEPPEENKENTAVKIILDYINEAKRELTGNTALRGYRETTAVKRIINARLKEKFTVDDFKQVIDFKCVAWKDDKKMQEYIRPSTLFNATHFPEYLCAAESYGKQAAVEPFQKGEKIHSAEDVYNRMRKEAGK